MEGVQQEHEYGYVQDGNIYLSSFLDLEDRKIGTVKESIPASLKYFEDRFVIAHQKVLNLEELIEEAQNKGSYLMKLVHMRRYLANFDGLGDYVILFAKLDEMEKRLRSLIAVNRVKNLEIKQALLAEAEEILVGEDILSAVDEIKEIKQKWIKTGSVLREEQEVLEERFREVYQEFFDKRKEAMDKAAEEARQNINRYRSIIEKAERLKNSDNFDDAFKDFRELQAAWKKAGKIPHKKAVYLWEHFRKVNDFFFTRFKKYKSFRENFPDMEPYEIRESIQDRLHAEAIRLSTEKPHENTAKTKALLMEWKELTSIFRRLDRDKSAEFREACDRVFEESYLMRVVTRKYPLFDTKPIEDQLRIKTSFMRELIRRDEEEASITESKIERTSKRSANPRALRTLQNNLNIQKRKIEVKKLIQAELEAQLSQLRK